MVVATPTKKARIWQLQHEDGCQFQEIANILRMNPSTVSCTYHKLKEQGPNPDFYSQSKIGGSSKLITPHSECRAIYLITSGECHDATAVQHTLFPNLASTTVRAMFQRNGLNGWIRRKKPCVRHVNTIY
ncbi:hypothetical protein BDQ12DRAFT_608264 [Crucibulum laeve]|uniref:Transposase IS30-like HTH domain-containing protein n=1 Tax=Crucibulum laeve TaxID=68775 RepID=A0A5C3M7N0_9AGAR|nr:hypothetical protein BDQ12DRAFT_608264 [Crucibulum laeve]